MINCVICGKIIEETEHDKEMKKCFINYKNDFCSRQCITADFWVEKIEIKNDDDVARINGEHYVIGDEKDNGGFRGFDGRKFTILFFDGRYVTTTNLWFNGVIPESFRKLLPDNAKFMQDKIEG